MQAAQELGYASAVLFASSTGYPFYQKLGYQTVVRVDFYAWEGKHK
jgi:hypothetical protein